MKTLQMLTLLACLGGGLAGRTYAVWTWTDVLFPGSSYTYLRGISDGTIVGNYMYEDIVSRGFLRNGNSGWVALNPPTDSTATLKGISGGNSIGIYHYGSLTNQGFLYDGSNWTTLSHPGASITWPVAISGSTVVGEYVASGYQSHKFLYNLSDATWSDIVYPGGDDWGVTGISGNTIVGGWWGDSKVHGLLYDGTSWKTLDYPNASNTYVQGVSGNLVVGYYTAADSGLRYTNYHGFVFDGTTWTTIDYPGAFTPFPPYRVNEDVGGTKVYGVSGNQIVGNYIVDGVHEHGFIVTIPEPASISLLALGGMLLARRRRGWQSSTSTPGPLSTDGGPSAAPQAHPRQASLVDPW